MFLVSFILFCANYTASLTFSDCVKIPSLFTYRYESYDLPLKLVTEYSDVLNFQRLNAETTLEKINNCSYFSSYCCSQTLKRQTDLHNRTTQIYSLSSPTSTLATFVTWTCEQVSSVGMKICSQIYLHKELDQRQCGDQHRRMLVFCSLRCFPELYGGDLLCQSIVPWTLPHFLYLYIINQRYKSSFKFIL